MDKNPNNRNNPKNIKDITYSASKGKRAWRVISKIFFTALFGVGVIVPALYFTGHINVPEEVETPPDRQKPEETPTPPPGELPPDETPPPEAEYLTLTARNTKITHNSFEADVVAVDPLDQLKWLESFSWTFTGGETTLNGDVLVYDNSLVGETIIYATDLTPSTEYTLSFNNVVYDQDNIGEFDYSSVTFSTKSNPDYIVNISVDQIDVTEKNFVGEASISSSNDNAINYFNSINYDVKDVEADSIISNGTITNGNQRIYLDDLEADKEYVIEFKDPQFESEIKEVIANDYTFITSSINENELIMTVKESSIDNNSFTGSVNIYDPTVDDSLIGYFTSAKWKVRDVLTGDDLGQEGTITSSGDSININNLEMSTKYEIYFEEIIFVDELESVKAISYEFETDISNDVVTISLDEVETTWNSFEASIKIEDANSLINNLDKIEWNIYRRDNLDISIRDGEIDNPRQGDKIIISNLEERVDYIFKFSQPTIQPGLDGVLVEDLMFRTDPKAHYDIVFLLPEESMIVTSNRFEAKVDIFDPTGKAMEHVTKAEWKIVAAGNESVEIASGNLLDVDGTDILVENDLTSNRNYTFMFDIETDTYATPYFKNVNFTTSFNREREVSIDLVNRVVGHSTFEAEIVIDGSEQAINDFEYIKWRIVSAQDTHSAQVAKGEFNKEAGTEIVFVEGLQPENTYKFEFFESSAEGVVVDVVFDIDIKFDTVEMPSYEITFSLENVRITFDSFEATVFIWDPSNAVDDYFESIDFDIYESNGDIKVGETQTITSSNQRVSTGQTLESNTQYYAKFSNPINGQEIDTIIAPGLDGTPNYNFTTSDNPDLNVSIDIENEAITSESYYAEARVVGDSGFEPYFERLYWHIESDETPGTIITSGLITVQGDEIGSDGLNTIYADGLELGNDYSVIFDTPVHGDEILPFVPPNISFTTAINDEYEIEIGAQQVNVDWKSYDGILTMQAAPSLIQDFKQLKWQIVEKGAEWNILSSGIALTNGAQIKADNLLEEKEYLIEFYDVEFETRTGVLVHADPVLITTEELPKYEIQIGVNRTDTGTDWNAYEGEAIVTNVTDGVDDETVLPHFKSIAWEIFEKGTENSVGSGSVIQTEGDKVKADDLKFDTEYEIRFSRIRVDKEIDNVISDPITFRTEPNPDFEIVIELENNRIIQSRHVEADVVFKSMKDGVEDSRGLEYFHSIDWELWLLDEAGGEEQGKEPVYEGTVTQEDNFIEAKNLYATYNYRFKLLTDEAEYDSEIKTITWTDFEYDIDEWSDQDLWVDIEHGNATVTHNSFDAPISFTGEDALLPENNPQHFGTLDWKLVKAVEGEELEDGEAIASGQIIGTDPETHNISIQNLEQRTDYILVLDSETWVRGNDTIRSVHTDNFTFSTIVHPDYKLDIEISKNNAEEDWKHFEGDITLIGEETAKQKLKSASWEIWELADIKARDPENPGGLTPKFEGTSTNLKIEVKGDDLLEYKTEYAIIFTDFETHEGENLYLINAPGWEGANWHEFDSRPNPEWGIDFSFKDIVSSTNRFEAIVDIDYEDDKATKYFESINWNLQMVNDSGKLEDVPDENGKITEDGHEIKIENLDSNRIYQIQFVDPIITDDEIKYITTNNTTFTTTFNPNVELEVKINNHNNVDEPRKTFEADVDFIGNTDDFNSIEWELWTRNGITGETIEKVDEEWANGIVTSSSRRIFIDSKLDPSSYYLIRFDNPAHDPGLVRVLSTDYSFNTAQNPNYTLSIDTQRDLNVSEPWKELKFDISVNDPSDIMDVYFTSIDYRVVKKDDQDDVQLDWTTLDANNINPEVHIQNLDPGETYVLEFDNEQMESEISEIVAPDIEFEIAPNPDWPVTVTVVNEEKTHKAYSAEVNIDMTSAARSYFTSIDYKIVQGQDEFGSGKLYNTGDLIELDPGKELSPSQTYTIEFSNVVSEDEIGIVTANDHAFQMEDNPDYVFEVVLSNINTSTTTFDADVNINTFDSEAWNYFRSVEWQLHEAGKQGDAPIDSGLLTQPTGESISVTGLEEGTRYVVSFVNEDVDSEVREVNSTETFFWTTLTPPWDPGYGPNIPDLEPEGHIYVWMNDFELEANGSDMRYHEFKAKVNFTGGPTTNEDNFNSLKWRVVDVEDDTTLYTEELLTMDTVEISYDKLRADKDYRIEFYEPDVGPDVIEIHLPDGVEFRTGKNGQPQGIPYTLSLKDGTGRDSADYIHQKHFTMNIDINDSGRNQYHHENIESIDLRIRRRAYGSGEGGTVEDTHIHNVAINSASTEVLIDSREGELGDIVQANSDIWIDVNRINVTSNTNEYAGSHNPAIRFGTDEDAVSRQLHINNFAEDRETDGVVYRKDGDLKFDIDAANSDDVRRIKRAKYEIRLSDKGDYNASAWPTKDPERTDWVDIDNQRTSITEARMPEHHRAFIKIVDIELNDRVPDYDLGFQAHKGTNLMDDEIERDAYKFEDFRSTSTHGLAFTIVVEDGEDVRRIDSIQWYIKRTGARSGYGGTTIYTQTTNITRERTNIVLSDSDLILNPNRYYLKANQINVSAPGVPRYRKGFHNSINTNTASHGPPVITEAGVVNHHTGNGTIFDLWITWNGNYAGVTKIIVLASLRDWGGYDYYNTNTIALPTSQIQSSVRVQQSSTFFFGQHRARFTITFETSDNYEDRGQSYVINTTGNDTTQPPTQPRHQVGHFKTYNEITAALGHTYGTRFSLKQPGGDWIDSRQGGGTLASIKLTNSRPSSGQGFYFDPGGNGIRIRGQYPGGNGRGLLATRHNGTHGQERVIMRGVSTNTNGYSQYHVKTRYNGSTFEVAIQVAGGSRRVGEWMYPIGNEIGFQEEEFYWEFDGY